MHQIIVQHFSANLKRVFRELAVSRHNPFSDRFYRCLDIVQYRFSASCSYSSSHLISLFFFPKSLVNNDINALLCKTECNIP